MKRTFNKIFVGIFPFIILLLIPFSHLSAQETWIKIYYKNKLSVRSGQQTSDNGYIIGGSIGGYLKEKFYLIKTDTNGNELWSREYGVKDSDDWFFSVKQAKDGGYILAGCAFFYRPHIPKVYLVKTDSLGKELWSKIYGESSSMARAVQQTTDGGYIVTGEKSLRVYLIKTDSFGDTLWTKMYAGGGGLDVKQTNDGGYIIAGYADVGKYENIYLIKTDSIGDTLWTRRYGYTQDGWGYSVHQTTEGGYIVAGVRGFEGEYRPISNIYIIKTDSSGNIIWTKTIDENTSGEGRYVSLTKDGGYIITGLTDVGYSVFLVNIDNEGVIKWKRKYLGNYFGDYGQYVQQTNDGGFAIIGVIGLFNGGFIIKTDENGIVEYTEPEEEEEEEEGEEEQQHVTFKLHQNYPNPFNRNTAIRFEVQKDAIVTLKIYSVNGKEVNTLINEEPAVSGSKYVIYWDATDSKGIPVSSGVYFYQIRVKGGSCITKKMAIIR